MSKRLSERAADDLIAFVRKVMREGHADFQGLPSLSAEAMGNHAKRLLAKHGLLTPADDPEVARVFMQEGPDYSTCDLPECEMMAESRFDYCCSPAHQREMHRRAHLRHGSPSRFHYADKEE